MFPTTSAAAQPRPRGTAAEEPPFDYSQGSADSEQPSPRRSRRAPPSGSAARDPAAISEAGRRLISRPPRRLRKALIQERIAARAPVRAGLGSAVAAAGQQHRLLVLAADAVAAELAGASQEHREGPVTARLQRVIGHLNDARQCVARIESDLEACQASLRRSDAADLDSYQGIRSRERSNRSERERP